VGRLHAGQRVTIDIDGEEDVVDAVAASEDGSRLLVYVRRASPVVLGRLINGSLGYLLYTHKGALMGLRGLARITPATRPLTEFLVEDGRARAERRASERIAIVTRARIAAVDDGGPGVPLTTFTANISSTGVLVRRPAHSLPSDEVSLELFFGTDPTPVTARGQIVRRTDEHLGIHFAEIGRAERTRLAGLLAGHQRSHRFAA
jgi:hypothetical protein